MTEFVIDIGSTARVALAGWGATVRMVIVLIVITICYLLVLAAL